MAPRRKLLHHDGAFKNVMQWEISILVKNITTQMQMLYENQSKTKKVCKLKCKKESFVVLSQMKKWKVWKVTLILCLWKGSSN